jgi:hypothetical protein
MQGVDEREGQKSVADFRNQSQEVHIGGPQWPQHVPGKKLIFFHCTVYTPGCGMPMHIYLSSIKRNKWASTTTLALHVPRPLTGKVQDSYLLAGASHTTLFDAWWRLSARIPSEKAPRDMQPDSSTGCCTFLSLFSSLISCSNI